MIALALNTTTFGNNSYKIIGNIEKVMKHSLTYANNLPMPPPVPQQKSMNEKPIEIKVIPYKQNGNRNRNRNRSKNNKNKYNKNYYCTEQLCLE